MNKLLFCTSAIVILACAALAENPAIPSTGINRVHATSSTGKIEFDNAITFKNSGDRAALASELGIAGGVAGVTDIAGQSGSVSLAELSLVIGTNIQAWNATLDAIVAGTRTINGHALTSNLSLGPTDIGAVPTSRQVNGHALTADVTVSKGDVGLGNVENTAVSTWAGSTNLTTLGTVIAGAWHGTAITDTYISSASTWNAKQNALTAGTDYLAPNGSASRLTNLGANAPIWLLADFGGGITTGEALDVCASYDLKDWRYLSVYEAPVGTVRDPVLMFHRGRWYCSYTMYYGPTSNTWGLAASDDLLNWNHVADVSIAGAGAGSNVTVWGPLICEDANGDAFCIVLWQEASKLIFMRPDSQDDLSSWHYVSDVSFTGAGYMNSLQLAPNGTYYGYGPSDSGKKKVWTASQPQGPYSVFIDDIRTVGGLGQDDADASSAFYDRDGSVTIFYNCQNNAATLHANGLQKVAQISPSGWSAFGSAFKMQRAAYLTPKEYWGYQNPNIRRCYGSEAMSVRAALAQRHVESAPQMRTQWPNMPGNYNGAFAHTGNGDATWDGAFDVPFVRSGTTAGNTSTVMISRHMAFESFDTGTGFLYGMFTNFGFVQRDMTFFLNSKPQANAVNRILLGVQNTPLQGTLNQRGIGFEMDYNGVDGHQRVQFLAHDGTTLTKSHAISIGYGAMTLRVRIDGPSLCVWLNGVEWFRDWSSVPAGTLPDGNYNAIVMQADCITDGPEGYMHLIGGWGQYFSE